MKPSKTRDRLEAFAVFAAIISFILGVYELSRASIAFLPPFILFIISSGFLWSQAMDDIDHGRRR